METKYAVPNYTFANLPGRRVLKAKKLLGMYITQNEEKKQKIQQKNGSLFELHRILLYL